MDFVKINVNGKEHILKYTFKSMKLMGDFQITQDYDKYPMRVFEMLSQLFYGGMNWANDKHYTLEETDKILESYIEGSDVNISEFVSSLSELLTKSDFFKKLLNNEEKPVQKKARSKN